MKECSAREIKQIFTCYNNPKGYLLLYSFFQKEEIQLSNKHLTTACPGHNGSHHASFIYRTNPI
jgi:hypothetical protein